MKCSPGFAALMLVVSLFFVSTSAFATWTSTNPGTTPTNGTAIDNVSISLTNDIYNIDMTLRGAPVPLTTYSVLLGSDQKVLTTPSYLLDASAYLNRLLKLNVSFDAQANDGSDVIYNASWDKNNNKLTWLINKSEIFAGNNFWFTGVSSPTADPNTIHSQTTPTATPIPGAIWLLGSGIMGLVGLKRRNTHTSSLTERLAEA